MDEEEAKRIGRLYGEALAEFGSMGELHLALSNALTGPPHNWNKDMMIAVLKSVLSEGVASDPSAVHSADFRSSWRRHMKDIGSRGAPLHIYYEVDAWDISEGAASEMIRDMTGFVAEHVSEYEEAGYNNPVLEVDQWWLDTMKKGIDYFSRVDLDDRPGMDTGVIVADVRAENRGKHPPRLAWEVTDG